MTESPRTGTGDQLTDEMIARAEAVRSVGSHVVTNGRRKDELRAS